MYALLHRHIHVHVFLSYVHLQEAYPSYPELLLLAISLGRRVQEPLHEFASLFLSHDDEILALRMQVLQVCVYFIV